MGSHNSRNMDDEDSRSSEYEIANVRYAELLQSLINSNNLVAYNEDYDVDNGGVLVARAHKPCVAKLMKSEFYFDTKLASGLINSRRRPVGNNITSMILNRERNMCPYEKFSRPNKIRIENWFLPNRMERIARYAIGKVFCGVYSKDGNYFLTGAQDQMLRLYDCSGSTYKLHRLLRGRDIGWSVLDVGFSPDQKFFAYSTWSSQIHLCPIEDEEEKQIPLTLIDGGRRFAIFSFAFASDGKEVLGGGNDGFFYIYDLEKNQRTLAIQAHDFDINSVAFADDSSHIIYSGGDDGLIKVWDRRLLGADDCKPVGVLAGHKDGITYIDTRGDGRYLISNSKDQSIKLWDVRVFSSQCAVENTKHAVRTQTWDYRWQGVPKKLFNSKEYLQGDTSVMSYRGHVVTRTLIRCKFSPMETTGQRYIYTGCGLGRLIIYDALTGKIKRELKKHAVCVRDVAWHPTRNEIMTCSWDKSIGRWTYAYRDVDESQEDVNLQEPGGEKLRRSLRIALRRLRNVAPQSDSDD